MFLTTWGICSYSFLWFIWIEFLFWVWKKWIVCERRGGTQKWKYFIGFGHTVRRFYTRWLWNLFLEKPIQDRTGKFYFRLCHLIPFYLHLSSSLDTRRISEQLVCAVDIFKWRNAAWLLIMYLLPSFGRFWCSSKYMCLFMKNCNFQIFWKI